MKNVLRVLEREQNLLKNGILNFAFRLSQLSVIAFKSWNLHLCKANFYKRVRRLKGYFRINSVPSSVSALEMLSFDLLDIDTTGTGECCRCQPEGCPITV